jgi:hypothetical protein
MFVYNIPGKHILHKTTRIACCPKPLTTVHNIYESNPCSPLELKDLLQYFDGKYPEKIPLTKETKMDLREEVIHLMVQPKVTNEHIKFWINYLNRREAW